MIKLYHGDCLVESDKIESGSVDLILTDLPYGTVKGLGNSRVAKEKKYNVSEWDITINTSEVFEIANRILRKNGKMILTANQPFTTELISKAIPNLLHCYNMYWDKMHFANCLTVNKAPVSYVEDVLIFSKSSETVPDYDEELEHPLRKYAENIIKYVNFSKKQILEIMGQSGYHFLFRINSSQFRLPPKRVYHKMAKSLGFYNANFFIDWDKLKEKENIFKQSKENKRLEYLKEHNKKYPSTFNLWEGKKYKSNILKYKKDYTGLHPTQKPVLLLEDLIKTFSNENNLVVDLTMGSGSTGVACVNTNRDFIGIELDDNYFQIAKDRIEAVQAEKTD